MVGWLYIYPMAATSDGWPYLSPTAATNLHYGGQNLYMVAEHDLLANTWSSQVLIIID